MALSNEHVVQSKALSQYFTGTTRARIQMHSFSEKLNPVIPPGFFSIVAIIEPPLSYSYDPVAGFPVN